MKKTLLFILAPLLGFCQTQIGNDIDGKTPKSSNVAQFYGTSISLSSDGNIIAIGDKNYFTWSGTLWMYKNIAGTWTPLGNSFGSGGIGDSKGESVSLSSDGTIVAVGSSAGWGNGRESGFVQVYKNISGKWTQIGANINGEFSGDSSGTSVSLSSDGNVVAIGSPYNRQKVFQAGSVRVFQNIAGVWTKVGADLDGVESADQLGSVVSLSNDGSIVAICTNRKYVRVYKNIAGTWTLLGNEIPGENFNISLSGDGSTITAACSITEYVNNERLKVSYVKVFRLVNDVWTQLGTAVRQKSGGDDLGKGLSISENGSILAIGSPGAEMRNEEYGIVRLYQYLAGNWTQIGVDIKGEANYDKNGICVTLTPDGTKLAIGASYNDGGGEDRGSVRVYNLSPILNTNSFVMSHSMVYPNPASEIVNINLEENLILEKVNIYNIMGQLIKTEKANNISINSFSKGTYYFEIITDQGKATKAIIVN